MRRQAVALKIFTGWLRRRRLRHQLLVPRVPLAREQAGRKTRGVRWAGGRAERTCPWLAGGRCSAPRLRARQESRTTRELALLSLSLSPLLRPWVLLLFLLSLFLCGCDDDFLVGVVVVCRARESSGRSLLPPFVLIVWMSNRRIYAMARRLTPSPCTPYPCVAPVLSACCVCGDLILSVSPTVLQYTCNIHVQTCVVRGRRNH